MATPTPLPYDIKSPKSIFEYSKQLLGRRLRDFVTENYEVKRGKGSLGQMVENIFFLLETNSYPGADFSEAGMELKCTPLLKGKHDQLHIKERLVCNMINYNDVVNEDFEHSHFYLKCQLMLLLFYLHLKDCDNLDLEFLFSVLWKLPEKDLLIIRHDYEVIVDKIKQGKAHELSEGDTMYLGACRKGAKGDKLVSQPNNAEVLAPRRAFSLKMAYMRTVLSYVVESGKNAVSNVEGVESELVSVRALKKQSFDDILLSRFRPYMHLAYQSIAKKLRVDISNAPKNMLFNMLMCKEMILAILMISRAFGTITERQFRIRKICPSADRTSVDQHITGRERRLLLSLLLIWSVRFWLKPTISEKRISAAG